MSKSQYEHLAQMTKTNEVMLWFWISERPATLGGTCKWGKKAVLPESAVSDGAALRAPMQLGELVRIYGV